ncbi:MAG TPA: ester cyclase [Solirubrobacteraceae bacterium]|nr:ester cyclase [Solirubrobacteraceae bacterium]
MSADADKQLVRRFVQEVVVARNAAMVDQLAAGEFAHAAKRWVSPFQSAFPDFQMEVVDLIAEGGAVVGHFKCSGTHRGEWLGVPATGRRFEDVDEVYIFRVRDGRVVSALGVEDNLARLRQLGIDVAPAPAAPDEPAAERHRYNLGSGTYGLITVSALIAAESATRETYAETVVGVVLALILFWLAHAYSELVGWRLRRPERLTWVGLGRALRQELPILVGATPPLLALLIAWVAGAKLGTAITIALWTAAAALFATEFAAGIQADLCGRDLAIQALVGAALGVLILALKLALH